jgi:polyhydroxyalkanoate synthesis regulator phasin
MANTLKSYIDAGVQFTEMSKKQAEALVRSLVKSGEVRRKDAEQLVQSLVARGKETTDRISETVQEEVAKQMKAFSARFDDLEGVVESLAASLGVTKASGPQPAPAPTQPAAKKTATKKTATKKTATKKKAAKKSTAKKSTARKKASGAAVGSSGVRKVSTTRPG